MRRALLVSALLACPLSALADPPAGQIDPTFGDFDGGVQGLQLEGLDVGGDYQDHASAMSKDAHGRLVVAGIAETDDEPCLGLMRFTPDGQLDTADFGFNPSGIAKGKICYPLPSGISEPALNMEMLSDGSFYVSGLTSSEHPFLCRFSSDGRIYPGFGDSNGCVTIQIPSFSLLRIAPIPLLKDDFVYLIVNSADGLLRPVVTRLLASTGAVQPFGQMESLPILSPTIVGAAAASDAVLGDDGDLILAGLIEGGGEDVDAFVARFDFQDQQPDEAFGDDGMARFTINKIPAGTDQLTAMTLLPDGKIVAAGGVELADRSGVLMVQVDATTGQADPEFNGGQPKVFDACTKFLNGCDMVDVREISRTASRIVVGINTSTMLNGILVTRLTVDGNTDKNFGENGTAYTGLDLTGLSGFGMVTQDERIVLATTSHLSGTSDFALLRLSDGSLFNDEFEAETP